MNDIAYVRHASHKATAAEMELRYEALIAIVEEIQPCTVRQAFYQAVVRDVVGKTEADYEKVQRALLFLRRDGRMDYDHIVDSSRIRWMPRQYDTTEEALEHLGNNLRLNLWRESPYRVEVWLEKLALESVISRVTSAWGIPLYVSRGFSSDSYLYNAASEIAESERETYIYFLTDHDPSGLKIESAIRRGLLKMVDDLGGDPDSVNFERLGLLPEQIREHSLPSRPTKMSSHSHGFEGESTELDALHPDVLRELVNDAIAEHAEQEELDRIQREQELAREALSAMDFTAYVEQRNGGQP
ncbi:MAG: hypothetical protein ABJB97_08165 [Acidobacteriota bacterium]